MYVTLYDVVKHCLLAVLPKVFLNDTHVSRPITYVHFVGYIFCIADKKDSQRPLAEDWQSVGGTQPNGQKGGLAVQT